MSKNTQKIAVLCLVGILAFTGKSIITKGEEVPIAGIGVILNEYYESKLNSYEPNNEVAYPFSNSVTKLEAQPITKLITQAATNPVESVYKDIAIAQVPYYVNIRSKANEEGDIRGKLYNDSAATILEKKGDWYKVKSGSVTGYLHSDYVVTGKKVEELAKSIGKRIAVVTTATLKVREKASLDSAVLTLVPVEEELIVKKESDNWVKVAIDSDIVGYVSKEYVEIKTIFSKAISIEEEQAELEQNQRETQDVSEDKDENSTKDTNKDTTNDTTVPSSIRDRIVKYALQFKGNPYVWGGTSLTRGADCSGFTQSVFRNLGISISRTSRTQANGGRVISLDNIQPGDLIFYDRKGRINHVAMYIGGGKVIGASSPESGIRISNYKYRQPFKVVSYIN